jgi:drug/metabolite transporter (DMT)-like permease
LIAAAPLFLYLLFVRKNPFANMKPGFVLGFFLGLISIFIAEGVRDASASNAGFISGTFIIFVPIFALWFFGKKPKLHYVFVLGLSLLGLYFLTGQLEKLNVGDFFILVAALFTAIHLVLMGHYAKQNLDAKVLCFQQFLTVSFLSFLFALGAHKNFFVPAVQAVPLLFLGFFATLAVFFILMISLRSVSEVTAALILAIQPAFTVVFAVFWGGEGITSVQMLGGTLLVAAAVFNQLFPRTYLSNS